ncbi:cupin domain-containing protein [Jatrophihabitans sp. DSM 44399]|uniref:Cupin domain-containing protein n=1 Tax=Jatrophihabitans lederbergiae TaxID=3075547 RepID=A0ABU2JFS6_9ACTN|nr:cupin domain-containing protein [Jatrophihabitans sp. DSM 44399]MDT0263825.1 cupin domain-containing protein [Jatrophihabitans sp. DSM 44399]
MKLVSATEERTVATPAAVMVGLAAPSQGSNEVSTWRVNLPTGKSSPSHTIDRDQVWMPVKGSFTFTAEDQTSTVTVGEALVVPGGVVREFTTGDGDAEALVAMLPDGNAITGTGDKLPVPWAQ